MSNKNDPKYEKIKGKLERIIPLPEPQQSLALHRIAREEQESFDKIQEYFNRHIGEKIHEKLDRINNEKDNIKKLKLLKELSESNFLGFSLDEYKDLLKQTKILSEEEINNRIKEIKQKAKNPIQEAIDLQKLSEDSGLSPEECKNLLNEYRFDWTDFELILKIGSIFTAFGIFAGVITYWWETDKRRAQENNDAWTVLRSAREDPASNGRIDALESLSSGCKMPENIFTWLLTKVGMQEDCVKLVGVNLKSANLPGVDMANNDLSKSQLQNANLDGANLKDADLEGADLTGASLRKADLTGADLRGTNLQNVNLSNAILNGANITNANLDGANLSNADLRNASLLNTSSKDARFEGMRYNFNTPNFDWFKLEKGTHLICDREKDEKDLKKECKYLELNKADLQEVDLSNTYLQKANLGHANLRNTKLINADLRDANLTYADIRGADFTGAALKDVKINHAIYDDHTKLDKSIFFNSAKFYKISRFNPLKRDLQPPQKDFKDADLRRADLRKADLRGVDLTDANLEDADLRGANLEGAILDNAKLKGVLFDKETKLDDYDRQKLMAAKAYYIENKNPDNPGDLVGIDLSNRDLEKTTLREVKLIGAKLEKVNLISANLGLADLSSATLTKADLSRSDLSGSYLNFADLEGANLSGANLQKANLIGANLKNARLKSYLDAKTNLEDAVLIKAILESADLKDAVLINANLMMANLKEAKLKQADLRQANLEHADLRAADLTEADLSGANLENADLRGANLIKVKVDSRTNFTGALINEETKLDFDRPNGNFEQVAKIYEEFLKVVYFITRHRQSSSIFKNPSNPKIENLSQFPTSNKYKKGLINLPKNIKDCQAKINLIGIDLSDRDLTKVNLSCVDLTKISKKGLKNTILEKANLIGVNLRGVSLEGAKLDKAIYDQRTIEEVDNQEYRILFDRAYKIAPNSDLSEADLSDQVLDGLDLQGAVLEKAELPRAHLIGTQLQDAILKDADLTGAILKGTDLTGADLSGAKLKKVIGLTVKQLETVKSLKDAQFSPELCQVVREKLKETKGKIADCPQ
ncbi:MAG: pentapeptide repeat-containing protein [Microcystis aeruginosa Ma_MB_S_20031200_S102]|uniref:Pentapeptide repeat-containing protein n=1 Tax=Microcystis aeruginosa Ma_MB_S_20031200_S102 TaxID=2486254 RepID=A0A552EQN7_MICAE|nr:MAG: pentapeptide repeat-containing protein [Microcystis aeruginosa Ma_MB_S_20031200_S102D]TRU36777.1 MAG: pentapeptide repeat-containing protein [Microcystis aeruginosa Ma_MB_S_20031200_S102]